MEHACEHEVGEGQKVEAFETGTEAFAIPG